MNISNIYNVSAVARQCSIEKHRMLLFKNGVDKALSNDQIDSIIGLIEKESAKTIKSLKQIKKQNEKNG